MLSSRVQQTVPKLISTVSILLKLRAGDVLSFSYLGYKTVEKTIGSSNTLNVTMEEDANVLDEVVVTGLGIKRDKKALGSLNNL